MRATRAPLRTVIRYTRNFEADLARIEAFWQGRDFPQGYDRLLDEIEERVIVNLEQHPRMGRSFWAREAGAAEVLRRMAILRARYGADTEVREYLMADYIVLYALAPSNTKTPAPHGDTVHLLAIRHYKEMAYTLP